MTYPTIDTQYLESLLERVRAATGPDLELDWELHRVFHPYAHIFTIDPVKYKRTFSDGVRMWNVHFDSEGYSSTWQFPKLSASLDACAALQAEKLPGWNWVKTDDGSFAVLWRVTRFHNSDPLATDCLTFIAAILSALIAKGGEAA